DEPTSALTERETEILLDIIEGLRRENVGVIYISHRLEEVKRVGDRVTVLRDGRKIGTLGVEDADIPTMIRMMVGRDLTFTAIERQSGGGPEMLRVERLVREGVLHGISFSVGRGEIVAFFGLVGAGRTELARAIFGVDPIDDGHIVIDGRVVEIASPEVAVRRGLGFLA